MIVYSDTEIFPERSFPERSDLLGSERVSLHLKREPRTHKRETCNERVVAKEYMHNLIRWRALERYRQIYGRDYLRQKGKDAHQCQQ